LDLRGRVTITNGASGTLGTIQRQLSAIGAQSKTASLGTFSGNALGSMVVATNRLQQSIVGLRGTMLGAGFALGGIIATTKKFNESNFGYGFARITEFVKDGKLQLTEWKAAMAQAAKEARQSAQDLGTTPEVTMKAREEVEKLGMRGSTSQALYDAAMGLYLSEPSALEPGAAASFIGQVYSGYEKQRTKLAGDLGVDVNDEKFEAAYMKGLAAKAAVAAASSPLGPADTVEGMRQFAPLYAGMGIPYEFALAMLAHGSKYGFQAPELGTAFKSMGNKAMNPTATAMRILDARQIDRSKFMKTEAADPQKALLRLNNLLDGQLFRGKGGPDRKAQWLRELDADRKDGTMTSADFQQHLVDKAMKSLGKGWVGRADDVRLAVANSVAQASGEIDLPGYIGALREAGVSIGEIAQIFEGRHVARNTPIFEFYDKLIKLYEDLKQVDGQVIDAVVEGRKESEAGKTDSLFGAWQNMIGALENTGVISKTKDALIALMNGIAAMPVGALTAVTAALVGLGAAAAGLTIVAGAIRLIAGSARVLGLVGAGAGAGGAAAAGGSMAALAGAGAGGVAAGMTAKQAGKALGRMGSATASGRFLGLGAGTAGAATAGAGWLARGGSVLGRTASRALLPLGLLMMGYDAYNGYQENGWKGALLNPLTLGMYSGGDASAAEGSSTDLPTVDVDQSAGGGLDIGSSGQQSVSDAQAIAEQIRAAFASIDLSSVGQQIMASLAAGITAGGAQAVAAANNVASQVRAAGQRVQLNTGPNMQPAR